MSLWLIDIIALLPTKWQNWILPPFSIPVVENTPDKVQLSRIAHLYVEHADLESFTKFAKDFGFVEAARKGQTIYYRGYGRDPYVYVASQSSTRRSRFLGAAFVAKDEENFEKAAAIPGTTRKTLDDAPGGGDMVTFARPNGTFFYVVYGQTEREIENSPPTATHKSQGPFNTPFEKPRKGQFQRYHDGPALVHKLGHYGYVCKEIDTELEFYTSNFNFVHSDILYLPQFSMARDVMTFMHLDLGDEYTDHHTFFLQRAPPTVRETFVHHTSFEVADFDTQLMGHHYLAKMGWKCVWGVGRHILGSQIFDYWYDSSNFKIEHYADGDVVNRKNATRREPVGPLSVWGPELPKDFGDNKAR